MKPLNGQLTIDQNPIISKRAFELDVLRGLSVLMMMLHHFIVDVRYLFAIDLFAFQETLWFIHFMQPFFVTIFILVSGICCQFSHNNFVRGCKLFLVSLALSLGMAIFSLVSKTEYFVFFNILHLLTVGTWLYACYDWIQKKFAYRYRIQGLIILILLGGGILNLQRIVNAYQNQTDSFVGLIFGLYPENYTGMADYLPIIPWLGFFFLGIVIGQIGYPDKTTLFPNVSSKLYKILTPLQVLGKKSLVVYFLHQPIIMGILFLLRKVGLI